MKKGVIIALIIDLLLITFFLWSGYVMLEDGDAFGIFEFLLGFGLIAVTIWIPIWHRGKLKEEKEAQEKARIRFAELQAKKEALNREVKDGTWVFPAKRFYLLCRDNNILNLDNEFAELKARQLAEKAIRESSADIDLFNCKNYLKKGKLKIYLKEGEALAKEAEAKKILKQKQPKNAKPTEEEKTFLARAKTLLPLRGNDKRIAMLENLYNDYGRKIDSIIEAEKAMKTLGMIYMDQQKKESSWAIMGGIADGIAGPAAGLAAAANTMANNAKIREYNASVRKTAMDIMSGIPSLNGDRLSLEKEQDAILEQLEADCGIVLSKPTSDEIWKDIKISNTAIKKNPSGVLTVSVDIGLKKSFNLDIPDGTQVVIDGTLKGDVLFEDKLVGEVIIPLPLYGIPFNMATDITLDGLCGRSVEYDGDYTIKFANTQNLWIMEA